MTCFLPSVSHLVVIRKTASYLFLYNLVVVPCIPRLLGVLVKAHRSSVQPQAGTHHEPSACQTKNSSTPALSATVALRIHSSPDSALTGASEIGPRHRSRDIFSSAAAKRRRRNNLMPDRHGPKLKMQIRAPATDPAQRRRSCLPVHRPFVGAPVRREYPRF